ncbi:MAG TPA: baseplate J/gp47 family protein, partial [Caldilineaceae bacterium]|nr:baseplate J/gp47 family protein [Caldilineaceae bacterium]
MTFRRRTYPELLDNILTTLVQGVSAETHPFPPTDAPPFVTILEHETVAKVISVYGSRNGQSNRFRPEIDFVVEGKTLTWQHEEGQLPDAGTLISVNYYPASAQANLTDIYPGSVLRTLSETVALEIGRLYAQLELVYQSGFIDTATGSALDNIVALLGIERVRGNHPLGEVLFRRAGSSRGVITIPAGTRITTVDGEVEYETTETVTMLAGQNTVRVNARDLETTNDPLPADQLTVLPIPIAGIESVTNPNPTSITTRAESDAAVRQRAKNFLAGSERATVGALRHAVERQGVTAEIIEDKEKPGHLRVNTFVDELPPELRQRVLTALYDARPAGVFTEEPVAEAPAKISLEIMLETSDGLLPADLRAIQEQVRAKVSAYFAGLATAANASINKLTGLVLGVS